MAAFDHIRDLYDIALKPRLLRSLLKEQLPDETRPVRELSELSSIVSTVKFHQLLSESVPNSANRNHVSRWRSAVDAWVDRILTLAGSNLPDKCWIGVCLLGVTCTECSSDRFLASYSDWLNALVPHIQPSRVSLCVKVASCAAVSDLLTRLGVFSNIKKDGTSHVGKLVQPILKTLTEDCSEAVQDAAAQLLSTILTYFPSSVFRHHDNAEGAIVSKIMCGSCSVNLLKNLAFCLASLPKSRGDEESWSLMMQKILLSLSSLLNDALEGLEQESRRNEAHALLVPPGKDHPPSLGGQIMPGEALNKGERSQQLLILIISSLMQSCCAMLTSSYPVQVTVPVRPLLAVIRRVLMVNGSLPETLQPFTTAMQQEFVCSHLLVLHLYGMEILAAVVKGMRSQLLPYAADIVRILMGYFKRCWLPELRTKVYSIIRVLLISMGGGIALHLSQEVINNGYIDLNLDDSGSSGVTVNEESTVEAALQHKPKKRKHGGATGPAIEQHASYGSEAKTPRECPRSIALKVAAIQTLEALLAVGGAMKSDGWRRRIDHLLIEVATYACGGGWSRDGKPFHPKEPRSTWEDFQLAALHALLASLLSPAGVRPPYLAQGIELFCKGKQGTGTKVAEFCAQALLALEVVVHPRALPLIDIGDNNYHLERTNFGGSKYKSHHVDTNFKTGYGNPHDVFDFLNDLYLENGSGSVVPVAEGDKNVHLDENMTGVSRKKDLEEPNAVYASSHKMNPDKGDDGPPPVIHVIETEANGNRLMLDKEHHGDHGGTSQEQVRSALTPKKDISGIDASDSVNCVSASGEHVPASKGIASTTGVESVVAAHTDNDIIKLSVVEPDNELSDPFPDIVDGDPDTDSDSE